MHLKISYENTQHGKKNRKKRIVHPLRSKCTKVSPAIRRIRNKCGYWPLPKKIRMKKNLFSSFRCCVGNDGSSHIFIAAWQPGLTFIIIFVVVYFGKTGRANRNGMKAAFNRKFTLSCGVLLAHVFFFCPVYSYGQKLLLNIHSVVFQNHTVTI